MNVGPMNVHESQRDAETRKPRIQDRRRRLQARELSPRAMRRTEVRNRRRRYLEEHPEYFRLPSHELAGPIRRGPGILSDTNHLKIHSHMIVWSGGSKPPQKGNLMVARKATLAFWKQISCEQTPKLKQSHLRGLLLASRYRMTMSTVFP